MYVFLNDKIISNDHAYIHINDLAILRGYALFDFLQAVQGVPLFIHDYLDRFYNSAQAMDLEIPYSRNELIFHINQLVKTNNFEHSGLKLVLTGGYSFDGFSPTKPNFFILETPIPTLPLDYQGYTHGVKLILHEFVREMSSVKSVNYITPITLQKHWLEEGAIDVLYHKNGFVTESSRSNFFIINDENILITPNDNVLHGITRKKTIEIAQEIMQIEIRDMSLEEVLNAKETFMCSSTKGILPVVKLDNHIINDGTVGKWTKVLMEKFNQLQQDYIQNAKAS